VKLFLPLQDGLAALDHAAFIGHKQMVEFLLSNNAVTTKKSPVSCSFSAFNSFYCFGGVWPVVCIYINRFLLQHCTKCIFGAWGSSARSVVRQIGSRVMEQTGDCRATQFLIQKISIDVQHGNAAAVMAMIPRIGQSLLRMLMSLHVMTL